MSSKNIIFKRKTNFLYTSLWKTANLQQYISKNIKSKASEGFRCINTCSTLTCTTTKEVRIVVSFFKVIGRGTTRTVALQIGRCFTDVEHASSSVFKCRFGITWNSQWTLGSRPLFFQSLVNVVYANATDLSQRRFAFHIVYSRITSLGVFSPHRAYRDQEDCLELRLRSVSRQEDKTSAPHLLLLLLMLMLSSRRGFFLSACSFRTFCIHPVKVNLARLHFSNFYTFIL